MSSMKIKLIGLLILMGCTKADAGNFSKLYHYKTPTGNTILTTRKVDKPGYKLEKVTDLSTSSTTIKTSSTNATTKKVGKPNDKIITIHAAAAPYLDDSYIASTKTVSTTNVSKYYNSVDWLGDAKKSLKYLKPGEQVQVLEVSPGLESYKSYSAQGYAAIGQSIFRDWDVSKDSLINQAKKVGATFVTFSKYTESIVPYTKSDDPNNLGFIYNYEVLFYVKDESFKNPNTFGIKINSIPLEKRRTYQRNTGVYVLNVVEGSRAYNANVLLEDVIIAINGNPISTLNDFFEIKEKELKKTKVLNLKILRLVNNELKELNIPVNF